MKVIVKLEITESRPEEMRVLHKEGWFLVQTKAPATGAWITQKEHKTEIAALADCLNWY